MIPPTPRSARRRPLLLAAVVTATISILGACSSAAGPHIVTATPEATPDLTAPPTTAPPTTAPPTTGPPPPPDLAAFIDRLPNFGAAPVPVPVTIPHAPGQAAFIYEVPTDQPVAFLTIDDGAVRHPMALELIKAAKVPVTLFLTTNYVSGHEEWFQALLDTGYVTIQNHSVTHSDLKSMSLGGANWELCTASDRLENWFGTRPIYFRPPFGNRDAEVLQAAWDCGMQAGFYWRETADNGQVWYQRDQGKIHKGDIILMHFRPRFPEDFTAALNAIKNSGLVPARLEDYLVVDGATPPSPPPLP